MVPPSHRDYSVALHITIKASKINVWSRFLVQESVRNIPEILQLLEMPILQSTSMEFPEMIWNPRFSAFLSEGQPG
jgi:hypothetical protein